MNIISNEHGRSDIREMFRDARVLITGGTGFMGQVMLEKLLRTCHEVKTIYLIIRPKKGKSEYERLQWLFDGKLFDQLNRNSPGYREKVCLITGNCSMADLGLSADDRAMLIQDVNIVFHFAATIRFDEELRQAFNINVQGLKGIMDLAREMPHLKALVHISTAYSNCPRTTIDEKLYSPPLRWTELKHLVESLDEDVLNAITPIIIGDWPNTYTFTKFVAEDMIGEIGKGLPIAIIRPSIVISTSKEPLVAWNNSVAGPLGIIVGCAFGIIRSMYCDGDKVVDLVPVDMVINATIAVAWDVAQNWSRSRDFSRTKESIQAVTDIDSKGSKEDIPIFNFVSSTQKPLTWKNLLKYNTISVEYPPRNCFWYFNMEINKYEAVQFIYKILFHLLPAILLDTAAFVMCKKPLLMKIYRKTQKFLAVTTYFRNKQWLFSNNNVQLLWKKLSLEDKILFDFNIAALDWEVYMFYLYRGTRTFIMGEGFENLRSSKQRYVRLKYLHYTVKYITLLVLSAVAFTFIFHYLSVYMKQLEIL